MPVHPRRGRAPLLAASLLLLLAPPLLLLAAPCAGSRAAEAAGAGAVQVAGDGPAPAEVRDEAGADGPRADDEGGAWEPREDDRELLVFFDRYAMQEEHRSAFERGMRAAAGADASAPPRWRWRTRRNPATLGYPTDFGLVTVRRESLDAFVAAARGRAGVRDVRPSRRFRDEGEARAQQLRLLQAGGPRRTGPAPARGLLGWFSDSGQLAQKRDFYDKLGHREIHETLGRTGRGARVGMFDSGVPSKSTSASEYMVHEYQMYDFTEREMHRGPTDGMDRVGHGTMTSFMIASTMSRCPGIAPDAEIFSFRVFDHKAETVTHWYLDSLNLAMALRMDVINVSIGGNDYADEPFLEKFQEACAMGITVVASAGNDGGIGTTLHPSNEPCVIAVGAINSSVQLADFTNKGVTIGELPYGFGRFKPDIVTFGVDVPSLGQDTPGADRFDCASSDGTSYAAPVVSGTVALLVDAARRADPPVRFSGAFAKQILFATAERFPAQWGIYGQGAGMLKPVEAVKAAEHHTPRATAFPANIDLTDAYFGGHAVYNSLYEGAMPQTLNVTVVNSMHSHGRIAGPPVFTPDALSAGGGALEVRFTVCERVFPHTGWLGVHVSVKSGSGHVGDAEGTIRFTVESPPAPGSTQPQRSVVTLPLKARVIERPPRERRVLWDQFHSVNYPRAWIPDDDSSYVSSARVDWRGDHPYMEYSPMAEVLRANGYFLEVLTAPLTCFDAAEYGHLIIMDPEDEYHPAEREKLTADVRERGLGLIVYADWYNAQVIKSPYYEVEMDWDVNFATGGSNAPALNDLLAGLGVAFGDELVEKGRYKVQKLPGSAVLSKSFTGSIVDFPVGGRVFTIEGQNQQHRSASRPAIGHAIAGVAEVGEGHVSVFADSNVLMVESDRKFTPAPQAKLDEMILLEFLSRGSRGKVATASSVSLFDAGKEVVAAPADGRDAGGDGAATWSKVADARAPQRVTSDVLSWSMTVGKELSCGATTPLAVQERVRSGELEPLPKFFLPTYRFEQEEEHMGHYDRDDFRAESHRMLLAEVGEEEGPVGQGPGGVEIEGGEYDKADEDEDEDDDVEGEEGEGGEGDTGGKGDGEKAEGAAAAADADADARKEEDAGGEADAGGAQEAGAVQAKEAKEAKEADEPEEVFTEDEIRAGAKAAELNGHDALTAAKPIKKKAPEATISRRQAVVGQRPVDPRSGQKMSAHDVIEQARKKLYEEADLIEKYFDKGSKADRDDTCQVDDDDCSIIPPSLRKRGGTLVPIGIAFVVLILCLLAFIWCAAFYNWRQQARRRASKRV